jgi:hypothetical protein
MGRATLMTISRMMPPPTSFPMASELMDTNIDPRGGHLTINKGRRPLPCLCPLFLQQGRQRGNNNKDNNDSNDDPISKLSTI